MKKQIFYVEGPDWQTSVAIDQLRYIDTASKLFEAGATAIKKILISKDLNLGPVVLIRKDSKTGKEFIVNSYICLTRAGEYKTAKQLRTIVQQKFGMDITADDTGYRKS